MCNPSHKSTCIIVQGYIDKPCWESLMHNNSPISTVSTDHRLVYAQTILATNTRRFNVFTYYRLLGWYSIEYGWCSCGRGSHQVLPLPLRKTRGRNREQDRAREWGESINQDTQHVPTSLLSRNVSCIIMIVSFSTHDIRDVILYLSRYYFYLCQKGTRCLVYFIS